MPRSRAVPIALFVALLLAAAGLDRDETQPPSTRSVAAEATTGSDDAAGVALPAPRPVHDPGARRALAAALRERLDTRLRADEALPPRFAPEDRTSARALRLLRAAGALRPTGVEREATGFTHQRIRVHKRGLPVLNRVGVLDLQQGDPVGRRGRVTTPPLAREPARLSREDAIERARHEIGVTALRAEARIALGWYALSSETVPAWRVTLPASQPFGSWQVTLDARSGRVLAAVDLVRTVDGVGSVYDPNLVLSPAPTNVTLFDLDGSGSLAGAFVRVFDFRGPSAFVPGFRFVFPPGDARFVQTSVYRGLTDTARYALARGFPAFARALPAYTNLPDLDTGTGEYNNAFYDPTLQLFAFGNGDGVITANLGTDFDVAAHEMGHHLFQELVDPEFTSLLDPVLAMSEAVADTMAALLTGDPDVGESTIPGRPYLRTLANALVFPDDLAEDPHQTGLIFGGTNWEIIERIGADDFTQVLFAALAQLPSDAVETDYRDAFLAANLSERGGAQQGPIRNIFEDRGFDELELPPEFEGLLEDGLAEARLLPDSPFDPDPATWNVDVFIFQEFPGSTSLTVQTTGSGDVDILVAALNDPTAPVATAENAGSNETIVLHAGTAPSIHADDDWLVAVFDFPDGSASAYTVTATATLPAAQIAIDGAPYVGTISQQGEVDLITFESTAANTVVRLEAQALDPTLDPIVGILDPKTFELFGVNDDSGPGTDSLIQGALLPTPGTYAIGILSGLADVDPTTGTGGYQLTLSTCDNTAGPDADGDGLVDACDDDDDADGFLDSEDTAPLDAALCADIDLDGCDDCSLGSFDPFDDGPDNDLDGICDLGDVDDDNDGCTDSVDPAPFAASADPDLDFFGSDCDDCSVVPDMSQLDTDADGYGNACDCDFDNDGFCTIGDFNLFLPDFTSGTDSGLGTDQDGDGFVTIGDFNLFRPGFLSGAPGPSGLAP